jgi:hypothetical protein
VVERCLAGDTTHPCSTIVRSQGVTSIDDFQVPEPWSGRLSIAPILFLSSNPSIGDAPSKGDTTYKEYPRVTWDADAIFEYFDYRFGGRPFSSILDGAYHADSDGNRSRRGVNFWLSVRSRAAEILGVTTAELTPGVDYALTEIVRCKSKDETGVSDAISTCVEAYLEPTLSLSAAKLIVVLGKHARNVMADRYQLNPSVALHERVEVANRQRAIVFLPHPSAWGGGKSLAARLAPDELDRIRTWLCFTDHSPE